MNGFRKLACCVLAPLFAAFAMSAGAAPGSPEKIFSISGIPASATAGSTLSVTVTFKNETPNGNSTINSLRLIAPAGWTLSNPAAIAGGSVDGGTPTLAPDGSSVSFANLPGIKSGNKTWMMQVSVSVPTGASCSNSWFAQAFTGNALGGDPFRLINSATSLNTGVNSGGGQATSFTMQPTNTTAGSAIPVAVGLTDACGAGPSGTPVTITADNGCTTTASGCLAGNTANTNGNGVASFTGLVINTPGTYTLTATPGASGFPTANSSQFTVYAGQIFCDDPLEALQANPDKLPFGTPGYAEGKRGKYNKDGSEPCVKVNYTFDNDILTDDRVHLSWDVNVQPYAAFSYTMFWKLRPVDADGWTSVRPDVAWDPDGNGQPIFVPGIACLSPNLPAPYGTLATAGGINASATTFTVSTTAVLPSGVKFPIVIGTERMQVESVSGAASPYTLNVTRGTGGTAADSHAFGDRVMSTPLPIYPATDLVYPNKQARVCVVEHGFTAAGTDADGTGLVGYFTTVIDIGDGWVRFSQ
jgi:hypothetical protein